MSLDVTFEGGSKPYQWIDTPAAPSVGDFVVLDEEKKPVRYRVVEVTWHPDDDAAVVKLERA